MHLQMLKTYSIGDLASFKTIKRSNTYNALIEVLKFRCNYCSNSLPLTLIDTHDRQCNEKLVQCSWEGCIEQIKRNELQIHTKSCGYRQVQCRYCKEILQAALIELHEGQQCLVRELSCENKLCKALIKLVNYKEHRTNCAYNIILCSWCNE